MEDDLKFGGLKYVQELKLINNTLETIKDKIVTGHGKREYARIKDSIDSLIYANSQGNENDGNWVSM